MIPPRPGDRFREIGSARGHVVESVVRTDGTGWIVRTADGRRWALVSPDPLFDERFRFAGEPLPDEHPPTPRLVP